MTTTWYAAKRNGKKGELLIFEAIGEGLYSQGLTAKKVVEDLKALGDVSEITVRINSPGGSVFDGLAMYNALRAHGARILVRVEGLAASIASVIAMAGDVITMPENAMMMIHNPWSLTVGDADELRSTAASLDGVKEGMLAAYHRKTGQSKEAISRLMEIETWMTAEEAKLVGFADVVEADTPAMAAHFAMLASFRKTPSELLASVTQPKGSADPVRAEWDSNPAVRQEFVNFESFAAYRRAEAEGRGPTFHRGGVVRSPRGGK